MPDQRLTIETGDDEATRQLARLLLVAEIASQIAALYLVLEMVDHGAISYSISWYWKRFIDKLRSQKEQERRLRLEVGRMLFEAERVLREPHG